MNEALIEGASPPRSDLENQAFAVAERAANWAADQTHGKTPRWDDIHPAHQLKMVMDVITVMSIKAVLEDPARGAH